MSIHGSIDLSFTMVDPANGESIELVTNMTSISQRVEAMVGVISLDILFETGPKITTTTYIGTDTVESQSQYIGNISSSIDVDVRIFFNDKDISVYCNDRCVYTYSFITIDYEKTLSLILNRTGNYTVDNIQLREIPDAREAVWVDYEATTESAIQSIIQQRPIEINPEVGREINFTYDFTKDDIPSHNITSYEDQEQDNLQMSSDGIVYYEDVGIAISPETAREVGFITRMYRLSELTSGAIEAAEKFQTSALQKRHRSSVEMRRVDPRIEIRDVILLDVVVTGTQKHIVDEIIVEDVSISLDDGNYSTRISGRKNG